MFDNTFNYSFCSIGPSYVGKVVGYIQLCQDGGEADTNYGGLEEVQGRLWHICSCISR
jgi:hypothetical protein